MKKYLKSLLLCLVVVVSATSCSTEYRTLSRMDRLTTRIEKNGERYTMDDWKAAAEEYKLISEDAKQCNFTAEESERMGNLEGRYIASFAQWAGDKVMDVLREGKGIIKGWIEGLKD